MHNFKRRLTEAFSRLDEDEYDGLSDQDEFQNERDDDYDYDYGDYEPREYSWSMRTYDGHIIVIDVYEVHSGGREREGDYDWYFDGQPIGVHDPRFPDIVETVYDAMVEKRWVQPWDAPHHAKTLAIVNAIPRHS